MSNSSLKKPPCEFMDNLAVRAYRDIFKFCPNRGFRSDIAITVKDQRLWESILHGWGHWYKTKKGGDKWKPHNPLNVKGMLDEYDRLERRKIEDAIQQKSSGVYSSESLPQQRNREMPALLTKSRGFSS